ncbi:N-acetylmuramic acid 6-phosphate etherase [Enterococcus asini]|uniref:N-acetylmuramic acid 6-phosphate etherase n=1 Tax=Enterococcus asini TaxID=57732 RepID=UPI0028905D0A|nr:N-acetylmuramic acid 6-phosphate etherase [Enterococcus asini]MDT2744614.1 N-acetylmuramic acid 6-phosphate etherase [Enterococcus asini]MDT2764377.1 N-acetylmuramic acid 6-phosphate etherase [Enterococcus asini]
MLEKLLTEKRNPRSMALDQMSNLEIITLMNQEDYQVIETIKKNTESIDQVIEDVVAVFKNGGRLFYIGAGTSGRLGILDAVECVPTFSTNPEMVQGLIAGGVTALTEAVEGSEDSLSLAEADLRQVGLSEKDYVLGISASGRTPYVIGGLNYAKQVGSKTGALSCNSPAEISRYAEQKIELPVGPEVLTGSTRLKAGTAQKLVLNMISTISMIRLGKVFNNLMVDVKPTNKKLVERSKRIIMEATGVSAEVAEEYYREADQNVKLAIMQILTGTDVATASKLLAEHQGNIREAIQDAK